MSALASLRLLGRLANLVSTYRGSRVTDVPAFLPKRIAELDGAFADVYALEGEVVDSRVEQTIRWFWSFSGRRVSDAKIDKRGLRWLSVGLGLSVDDHAPIILSNQFGRALKLFTDNWRSVYLRGILLAAFRHWSDLEGRYSENLLLLRRFIEEHLRDYSGRNSLLRAIAKNMVFFVRPNGRNLLAQRLVETSEFHRTLLEMGFPKAVFSLDFFVELALNYTGLISNLDDQRLLDLQQVAETVGERSVRVVIVAYVIREVGRGSPGLKETVQSWALSIVGDPLHKSAWRLSEAYRDRFLGLVVDAQKDLTRWVNDWVIQAFFESLSFYPERKAFWQRYLGSVNEIRIAAVSMPAKSFFNDPDRKAIISSRFIRTTGGPAALLIRVGRHLLVEFAEQGNAFYAFHDSHPIYEKAERRRLENTTQELKDTALPTLGPGTSQGRFIHKGGTEGEWQAGLARWLQNELRISPRDSV